MPRIRPDGPALAASPDGRLVAVLDRGHLTVLEVEERRQLGETTLPVRGVADLAFLPDPPRIVSATAGESATTLYAHTLPDLERSGLLEIPGALRVLSFVGGRAVLATAEGENAKVVALLKKSFLAELLPLRPPALVAGAAPEDRLLVEARGQLEFWDVVNKRALFRLNLPLPSPLQHVGFTARGRLLWVTAGGPLGRLEVFRFSDGRRQLQLDLGGPILGAQGSATTSRLLVAYEKEGVTRLDFLDLVAREHRHVKFEGPIGSFVLLESDPPTVVIAAEGLPLAYLPIGTASVETASAGSLPPLLAGDDPTVAGPSVAAAAVARPERDSRAGHAPAEPAAVAAPSANRNAADRFAAWRSRIRGGAADVGSPATPPAANPGADPPVDAAAESTPRPAFGSRPRSAGAGAGPPPMSDALRARLAGARPDSEPVAKPRVGAAGAGAAAAAGVAGATGSVLPRDPAPTAAPAEPAERAGRDWRLALSTWGAQALSYDGRADPPPLDGTPFESLQARFGLEPEALRILALLYADWLRGGGAIGLPAATVSSRVGDADDWLEVLGRGTLARLGFARARRGRVRLRGAAGRFLDGRPPRTALFEPAGNDPGQVAPDLESAVIVPVEAAAGGDELPAASSHAPDRIAERLARQLGRTIGLIDLLGLEGLEGFRGLEGLQGPQGLPERNRINERSRPEGSNGLHGPGGVGGLDGPGEVKAVSAGRQARRFRNGCFEARAHGAIPLAVLPRAIAGGWLAESLALGLTGPTLYLASGATPGELAALPRVRISAE